MKPAITLFTVLAALFIALGANRVLEQQQQLQSAKPVPATVVSADVHPITVADGWFGRKRTVYFPFVSYRMKAADGSILSDTKVFPPGQPSTTSEARARRIVAEFPKGKAITAWELPPPPDKPFGSPPQYFLLHGWSFDPYLVILFSMVHLSIGLGLWASRPWQRAVVWAPKHEASGGGFELSPRYRLVTRVHPWRAVTLAWYVIGVVAIGHYFVNAPRPYAAVAYVASGVYAVVGLFPFSRWLYHRRLTRTVRDAKVFTHTDTYRLGKTFSVRVEQAFRRAAHVDSVRVGLICERTLGRLSKAQRAEAPPRVMEFWTDVSTDQEAGPDRPLTAKTKLTPPADQPATTPEKERAYPRVAWRVAVEIRIAGRPTYREEYPIAVSAA
jgi:hypothetical protein